MAGLDLLAEQGSLLLRPDRLDALAWIFARSPDPVLATDARGRVVFANDAARARWGAGALGAELCVLIPAEARERALAAQASVLAGAAVARFEWGDQGSTGVRAWFACALTPLFEEGAVVGLLCACTDATEQKRTEARLRISEQLMVDTQGVAHLGTWEWSVDQPTATWSAELYRIYGLSPESYTPSYERYLEMVHPDDRQRVADATERVFRDLVPYSHDERIFRPDGSMRYLHTWAQPVVDESGRLTKLLGVCQDITDRVVAEEEVRELNQDLERRVAERTQTIASSMRDLEAFNSMVSHDLRAPLTAILLTCGQLELASAELPRRVADKVARIRGSANRMAALIHDLLQLARVGAGSLELAEVDLAALSTEVVEALRRASPEREVEVRIEPGLRCPGDPGLLRAAMENLIGNAWKYSSRTSRARIEVGATASGGRRTFFVRDNGVGFDRALAHRLFQPFQRLHEAADFEGTGIGLAAVHRIVERHGGRIWAEGEPGLGATFHFELPGA